MKATCPHCYEVNTLDVFHDGEVACIDCGETVGWVEVA